MIPEDIKLAEEDVKEGRLYPEEEILREFGGDE